MGLKKKALDFATSLLKNGIQCVARDRTSEVYAYLSEELTPTRTQKTNLGPLKFFCPGTIPEWRARTLLTKEPETIEWINTFDEGDILWDIGANVGVYSLYAALRGNSVYAFEPAPGNHYVLSRNIQINNFDDIIHSLCVAFTDKTRLDSFYMANTDLGSALNSFGVLEDLNGESFIPRYKQSMVGFSVDDFIRQFELPIPNHVKIDVDGIEKQIVEGAVQTIAQKPVKSVLIELNIELDECAEVVDLMKNCGLNLVKREHAPMFDDGPYSNLYNHIFIR